MGSVYRSPAEHDQEPWQIHYETQVERRYMASKEPQDILYRDRFPSYKHVNDFNDLKSFVKMKQGPLEGDVGYIKQERSEIENLI